MRCRNCDYPLWRIEARACPECGTGFKPSEFVFRPSGVTFHCPHCRQSYYGTGEKGHLEPPSFVCVQCHQPVTMDEMILEPAPGIGDDDAGRPPNPWRERKTTGLWKAWWRSVKGVLNTPALFAQSIPNEATIGEALSFFLVSLGLSTVLGLLFTIPIVLLQAYFLSQGGAAPPTAILFAQQAGLTVVGAILTIAGVFVVAAIVHLALKIFGGAKEGIGTTFRTLLYVQGGIDAFRLLGVIPCVGAFVGLAALVWWVISATIMLRVAHRTTTGRAVAATLTPTALALTVAISALAFVITAIGTAVARSGGGAAVTMPGPSALADGLAEHYARHETWPATPLEAVENGVLSGSELIGIVDDPSAQMRIGGLNQEDIIFGDRRVLERGSVALAAQLPRNGPYRLGEAAFCWNQVAPESTGGWLVIVRQRASPEPLYAVSSIGSEERVYADEASFAAALAVENERRQKAGEPEIPPFELITIIRTAP